MPTKSDILIIMPAFNEANHLPKLCNEINALGYKNICIVNDGSTDNTAQLTFQFPVIMLHHIINRGVGAATDTGLRYAQLKKYKAAITLDADAQHLANDIDALFNKFVETNADLIIGSRFLNANNKIPTIRIIYNKIANLFTRIFAGNFVSDSQSGIKLFSNRAISLISIETDGYEFCSEIIIKSFQYQLNIVEIPVAVFYTDYSLSKGQSMFTGFKTVFNLIANLLVKDKY